MCGIHSVVLAPAEKCGVHPTFLAPEEQNHGIHTKEERYWKDSVRLLIPERQLQKAAGRLYKQISLDNLI